MIVSGVARRPSTLAAVGLLGGFAAARYSHNRALGGAVFAAAGAAAAPAWVRSAGPRRAAAMGAIYTLAMGGSHPLAKRIGPWKSVLAVTAATAAASELVARS
jgi:cyanate permease